jgi:hypothetical protein
MKISIERRGSDYVVTSSMSGAEITMPDKTSAMGLVDMLMVETNPSTMAEPADKPSITALDFDEARQQAKFYMGRAKQTPVGLFICVKTESGKVVNFAMRRTLKGRITTYYCDAEGNLINQCGLHSLRAALVGSQNSHCTKQTEVFKRLADRM